LQTKRSKQNGIPELTVKRYLFPKDAHPSINRPLYRPALPPSRSSSSSCSTSRVSLAIATSHSLGPSTFPRPRIGRLGAPRSWLVAAPAANHPEEEAQRCAHRGCNNRAFGRAEAAPYRSEGKPFSARRGVTRREKRLKGEARGSGGRGGRGSSALAADRRHLFHSIAPPRSHLLDRTSSIAPPRSHLLDRISSIGPPFINNLVRWDCSH
jgi:hypothetical protein